MPKLAPPLTAKTLDKMKSGQELADGALPGLRVRNVSGELVWSLFVVPPGQTTKKRHEVGRGLGLAEARQKAQDVRKDVREGADPTAAKKLAKARSEAARDGVGTLEALIDSYFATGPGSALRTKDDQIATIKLVFEKVLAKPSPDVRRVELQLLADQWKSASNAGLAIGYIRPLMKWAAKRSLVATDDWRDLERPEVVTKDDDEEGQRFLTAEELQKLWPKLYGPYGEASKFLLYTAARLREATKATWAEIDLEAGTWTLTGKRRKDTRSKRRVKAAPTVDHVVPLPRQAVELLTEIHARHEKGPKPGALVFVGSEGGELVNWSRWLKGMRSAKGAIEPWSAHALRRTCATMAAELGAEPFVVQAILGHREIGGHLQAKYQRSRYTPEHRHALQLVADRVDAIVKGNDNVVQLRKK
jgi:integrase